MATYRAIVTIQWSLSTVAYDQKEAEDNITDVVNNLLTDLRFQDIRDESIEIDVCED